jgi:hypothetical protein
MIAALAWSVTTVIPEAVCVCACLWVGYVVWRRRWARG